LIVCYILTAVKFRNNGNEINSDRYLGCLTVPFSSHTPTMIWSEVW